MIAAGNEKVIDYFIAELQSLRQRASSFSEDYPEVANELKLGAGRSDDPHIEMLLQSFAYLTARLRYNMDSDLPEVPANLLKYLYPHLEKPIPSMGVLQVQPFPDTVDFAEGYLLKRGRSFKRKVLAQNNSRYDCHFRAAYDTHLWPLRTSKISLLPANRFEKINREEHPGVRSVLHLQLESINGVGFEDLKLESLRIFVNSANPQCHKLYERLQQNLIGVLNAQEENFSNADIHWLGFDESHSISPCNKRTHSGYRLLQEYLSFPEKFMFFDLRGIQSEGAGTTLNVYFMFDVDLSAERIVDKDSLLLNCVPVSNLYDVVTEPVRLNQKEYEYLLIPDARQYRACEIYSVKKVISTDVQGHSKEVPAFLPQQDVYHMESSERYWSARRDFTERKRFPGTETFISFHDHAFEASTPRADSIYAHTTCTNRDLAQNMRIGAHIQLVGEGPANNAVLVTKPTRYREPAVRGAQPWRLISHLTLNFSTLSQTTNGVQTLEQSGSNEKISDGAPISKDNVLQIQNLIRMYCEPDNLSHQRIVDSIFDMTTKSSVQHVGKDAWRGFIQGMALTMTIDEKKFDFGSVYMFGEVMSRFFTLYTTANSFVSLTIHSKQRDKELKKWPAMMGEKGLL